MTQEKKRKQHKRKQLNYQMFADYMKIIIEEDEFESFYSDQDKIQNNFSEEPLLKNIEYNQE